MLSELLSPTNKTPWPKFVAEICASQYLLFLRAYSPLSGYTMPQESLLNA